MRAWDSVFSQGELFCELKTVSTGHRNAQGMKFNQNENGGQFHRVGVFNVSPNVCSWSLFGASYSVLTGPQGGFCRPRYHSVTNNDRLFFGAGTRLQVIPSKCWKLSSDLEKVVSVNSWLALVHILTLLQATGQGRAIHASASLGPWCRDSTSHRSITL